MTWWAWLLVGLVAFVAITAVTFAALRTSVRGRRFLALRTRAKLHFGRVLLRDPQVPLAAKAMLGLLVAYLAMPLDLVPDFLPVIGQADDIAMIVVTVAIMVVLIPRERFEAALAAAEAAYPKAAEDRRTTG